MLYLKSTCAINKNTFINGALIVIIASIWSCTNENKFKKAAETEVKDKCTCFESAGISASPNVTRLLQQGAEQSDFNAATFAMSVSRLTPAEKEEVLQLTGKVYNDSRLSKCLEAAKSAIKLGSHDDSRWNIAMRNALAGKYACPFVRYFSNRAIIYATYAIEVEKLSDLACNCLPDGMVMSKNIIQVLEDALENNRSYIDEESYKALAMEDKLQLKNLHRQRSDKSQGFGQCVDNTNQKIQGIIDSIEVAVLHIPENEPDYAGSTVIYDQIMQNIFKQKQNCWFYLYHSNWRFSLMDKSIE